MRKIKLKDLKTANQVLLRLDYPVPTELKAHISSLIRSEEESLKERRMERMTDEQLLRLDERHRTKLRVTTSDGRIIQSRLNVETFMLALKESGADHLTFDGMRVRSRQVAIYNPSRQRISGYLPLNEGLFIFRGFSACEMQSVLLHIDQQLQLDWTIEVL